MKANAIDKLRKKLASDQAVYGLWVTLESASITEMAVAMGLDWVVVDAEHGHLDWHDILEHVRAAVRSDTVVLVRISELNGGLIKRVLDIGADGVVVPWIETADQAREAVAFAQYPPQGKRGIGAERSTCWGKCFVPSVKEANDHVLVVPIIESVRGGKNIEQICRVPGIDVVLLGPADYSSTAGHPGQWEGPGVAEELIWIKDAIRRSGKYCGIMGTSNADIARRLAQGFRVLCLGIDGGLLLRSLSEAVESIGRPSSIAPGFTPENKPQTGPPAAPLERPPEALRPDRPEVMTSFGSGPRAELDRGVVFEELVGSHNNGRNLTTGIVTFAPHAMLRYHTHEFTESVTLLEGAATIDVEGRRYTVDPLDNVVIPRGLAHQVKNAGHAPALFHVALASDKPARTPVERFFRRTMPGDSTGVPGAERINRHASAKRFETAPGSTFIDFFNRDLIPGVEMSGGYGLFRPGGRLPCHLHDFDESICIIAGNATCIVEGRRYSMSGYATALQPRGRCHYFVNESTEPMAMLWVYAGPAPERLVLDETNCTPGGSPWR
jgi:2-keto-3-deoxy-L-rhamnonate aldolase RhmA/quercetin dioxygenase-like cupin family protein